MGRKLLKLNIQKFVGIEEASIDFQKPVTLFYGENSQGKSSIKDALSIALTGKARGLSKYKDVGLLSKNGDFCVELAYETADEANLIKRTKDNASKNVDDNPLIFYAINPMEFIGLSAKERGRILSQVLGGGQRELVKGAIAKHVGDIQADVLKEIKGSGVDVCDVDALRDEVVNIRRSYKRLSGETPKQPVITNYDLEEDFDVAEVKGQIDKLGERIANGDEYIQKIHRMNLKKACIADATKRIESLDSERIDEPTAEVDSLYHGFAAELVAVLENTIKNKLCDCPACDKKLSDAVLKKMAEKIKKNERAKESAEVRRLNNALDQQIVIQQKMLNDAQTELGKLGELNPSAQKGLDTLIKERDELQKQVSMYDKFKRDCEIYKEGLETVKKCGAVIEECNRIDALLKDGGVVKAGIAAGGKKLPINEALAKLWGLEDIAWTDTGDITIRRYEKDIPIELASESEKYRAASLLALALAEVGDIGFCCLDGYEVLQGDNAEALFTLKSSKLNNLLIFASTGKEEIKPNSNLLQTVKVEKGLVSFLIGEREG